ncbi:MAG: hypothetical protein MRJ96_07910 [Nitrospirales bacterium]|nr:hypothetical protein [Nitrospirales bacterium]
MPFVDDAAGRPVSRKVILAGHEFLHAQTMGGGHEAADIDVGARCEIHAVGIGQEHLAVGVELAENLAGVGALDAIEYDTAGRGLIEIDGGLAANIECVPVNRRTIGGLVDVHGVVLATDAGLPSHDLFACR